MSFYRKCLLLLALTLICKIAWSQNNAKSIVSNNLLGTWIGIIGQTDANGGDQEPVKIAWRIHSIDTLKEQVELTDMAQRFNDGAEIENPIKLKYKGTYRDSIFLVTFDKQPKKLTFTFKVKRNDLDGKLLLMGQAIADDIGDQKVVGFHLVKVSDDTSEYVKPKKGRIAVTITSPAAAGR